jgi:transcriptional regulator with XRE-family HTH domain
MTLIEKIKNWLFGGKKIEEAPHPLNKPMMIDDFLMTCEKTHKQLMEEKYSRTKIRNALKMREVLISLIKEEMTQSQIRTRLGVSCNTIATWLEVLELKPNLHKIKKKHQRLDEIIDARKNGLNYAEIGKNMGLSRERIRQIVSSQAVEFMEIVKPVGPDLEKPSKRKNETKYKIDRDIAIKVMELRKQSMTWGQVAEKIFPGMSGVHLRTHLQRTKDIVFTKEELDEFFPKKRESKYLA